MEGAIVYNDLRYCYFVRAIRDNDFGKAMQKAGMNYDATLPEYFIDKNIGKRCDKVCYTIDR